MDTPANIDRPTLVAPDGAPLVREGDVFVSAAGQRFPVEGKIVRMLDAVDAPLAAELRAQEAALPIYLDRTQLMTRYEDDLIDSVLDVAGDLKGQVLDAGCGVGVLGRRRPDLEMVGLDASMTLLRNVGPGYKLLVECSAEKLPFAPGSFDVVVCMNALHHVVSPENAVAEFARVLRPGGFLVTVDPRKLPGIETAKRFFRRGNDAYAETHKAFRVDEYRQLVAGGGRFEIEELRLVGCLAPLYAGGMDALNLNARVPGAQALLTPLQRIDRTLVGVVRQMGLNIVVRARRADSTSHA